MQKNISLPLCPAWVLDTTCRLSLSFSRVVYRLQALHLANLRLPVLFKRRLSGLTRLYSQLAGQPLTTGDALRILHVQAASFFLLFPASLPLLWRVAALLWTMAALWQCRHIGK